MRGLQRCLELGHPPDADRPSGDACILSTPKGRNDFAACSGAAEEPAPSGPLAHRHGPTPPPAAELDALRARCPARLRTGDRGALHRRGHRGASGNTDIDDSRVTRQPASGASWSPSTRPSAARRRFRRDRHRRRRHRRPDRRTATCWPTPRAPTADAWARKAIGLYQLLQADCIIAEINNGGDMIEATCAPSMPTWLSRSVHAAAARRPAPSPWPPLYEQGRVHQSAVFDDLETADDDLEPARRSRLAGPRRRFGLGAL